ncbi:hypothetical protein CTE05_25510 [Cellulomonas terrae]|uniref:Uncharacterized protein n=1 Tax=Cellulomonas terrae TaxID=311234 RepID=A0A511JM30_9CELL|nr:hypothetical protein CTE05_25510 [Cellulomonas terrae]
MKSLNGSELIATCPVVAPAYGGSRTHIGSRSLEGELQVQVSHPAVERDAQSASMLAGDY